MQLSLIISNKTLNSIKRRTAGFNLEVVILLISLTACLLAILYAYSSNIIVAYGDAESHLNISKRVVNSLTPGFAQLGGIWLPLPHILMIPFVSFDFLWRSGLAGSIVSGIAYIVSSIFIYRTVLYLTGRQGAALIGALVFILNPNILYLQTTPMTELTLVVFFVLSSYFFIKYLTTDRSLDLIYAAFFGFCSTLTRYDGWFMVLAQAGLLLLWYMPWDKVPKDLAGFSTHFNKARWRQLEGVLVIFLSLAAFGILGWLIWDWLILGDPLYFTHSQFSAKSQQQGWLARGQLPAYQNLWLSFLYYLITSMSNIGVIIALLAIVGFIGFILNTDKKGYLIASLLSSIFVFYIVTLFLGQSIIFIPHITPPNFDWTLFNVRYGVMMVPFAAIFVGYLWSKAGVAAQLFLVALFIFQAALYAGGYSEVISYEDGVRGLSHSKRPDAEQFMTKEYDGRLVLLDDFSRTMSVIRSNIPMENIIYIGNKPYWEESFIAPEKHATWIIVQKEDEVWNRIYTPPHMQARLYAHFVKVYESPDILIFRKQQNKLEL